MLLSVCNYRELPRTRHTFNCVAYLLPSSPALASLSSVGFFRQRRLRTLSQFGPRGVFSTASELLRFRCPRPSLPSLLPLRLPAVLCPSLFGAFYSRFLGSLGLSASPRARSSLSLLTPRVPFISSWHPLSLALLRRPISFFSMLLLTLCFQFWTPRAHPRRHSDTPNINARCTNMSNAETHRKVMAYKPSRLLHYKYSSNIGDWRLFPYD